jgi:hypothetical protein
MNVTLDHAKDIGGNFPAFGFFLQQVKDATGAIGLGPRVREKVRVIRAHDSLIGRYYHTQRRIEKARHLIDGDKTNPFTIVL